MTRIHAFRPIARGEVRPRSARFYQGIVDLLNRPSQDTTRPPNIPRNMFERMQFYNSGTSTIEEYSPAMVVGPYFDPSTSSGATTGLAGVFAQGLTMNIQRVESGAWVNSGRPVVALHNIPPGKWGWCAISGYVPARVFTNVGLTTYNLGFAYPSYQKFWEVVGGPAINTHTQLQGYKILWQSNLISAGGEWRWCILNLGERGPLVHNLFTAHALSGTTGTISGSSGSSDWRMALGVPLKWVSNGANDSWGQYGTGNANSNLQDSYRPYVAWTLNKQYEFYRDVGLRFTLSGTMTLPTNSTSQTGYAQVWAYINGGTPAGKVLSSAAATGCASMPLSAMLYCPAGCYFQTVGGSGKFTVAFQYRVYVTAGTVGVGSVNNLTISCDVLHENYAATGGHLSPGQTGGPVVVP